ncbi:hypothetical protein HaLaN_08215 [Haematococcus lacustris]|uniref:Uncharacterized protein n=1 Tax=Haematococcus lacustris TaxID=44745 RepID=A0A699YSG4_HAELA|nr:hypothetical protein HaLaN_08215 [Haematococcus lacustris]
MAVSLTRVMQCMHRLRQIGHVAPMPNSGIVKQLVFARGLDAAGQAVRAPCRPWVWQQLSTRQPAMYAVYAGASPQPPNEGHQQQAYQHRLPDSRKGGGVGNQVLVPDACCMQIVRITDNTAPAH